MSLCFAWHWCCFDAVPVVLQDLSMSASKSSCLRTTVCQSGGRILRTSWWRLVSRMFRSPSSLLTPRYCSRLIWISKDIMKIFLATSTCLDLPRALKKTHIDSLLLLFRLRVSRSWRTLITSWTRATCRTCTTEMNRRGSWQPWSLWWRISVCSPPRPTSWPPMSGESAVISTLCCAWGSLFYVYNKVT